MVQVRDAVKKYFNGFVAVKGFSLNVFEGDSVGLLGPNGAGKTTVCSMVTGVVAPSEGSVSLWNHTSKAVQGSLGICAQHTTLFDDLTVREHLMVFAMIKQLPYDKASSAATDLLGKVGLLEKAASFPSQLSGGMQRKLAICLALVAQPGLVVLDEPTTGLDPMAREGIWELVQQALGAGQCNLITTHMLEEAEQLCTRILVMASGKLIVEGSPQELKDTYGSGYALTIECAPTDDDRVVSYLADTMRNPSLQPRKRTRAGQLEFGVGNDPQVLGALFQELGRGAAHHGVIRWGLSQSTLQDAYVAIVNKNRTSLSDITTDEGGHNKEA